MTKPSAGKTSRWYQSKYRLAIQNWWAGIWWTCRSYYICTDLWWHLFLLTGACN